MSKRPPTAVAGEGHPPYEEEFRLIGEVLERDAEQIMERWYERATDEQLHAEPEERQEAMNELLAMLRSLDRRLSEQSSRELECSTELAREHGRQRLGIGWDIVELVRDYEILHGVALEHLGEALNERLTYRQSAVIVMVVDQAIGSAVETFSDITNQRLADQVQRQKTDLRQLTFDLTNAEHHERQRIARQLHDDLQQLLVATQMRLRMALEAASPDRSAIEQAVELVSQTIEGTRNLTAELYPQGLENQSLANAIHQLAETFKQRYDLTVTVRLEIDRNSNPGPLPLRRVLYDAVRELLFNVVKHAQTDRAWVTICCEGKSPWLIEVEDRGVGMASDETSGFGLGSVRQRIEHVGGEMQLHSTRGEGTRIAMTVPLDQSPEAP